MSNRLSFEKSMEELNIELINMGAIVETAIENSIKALQEQNLKLAQKVIEQDRIIDDMEKNIESKCLSLILKQQPVAKDLKTVSTALKMVTDIERIGDHASDISEFVFRIKGEHTYNMIKHIPEMADAAKCMLHNAIKAFINNDVETAIRIKEEDDDIIDELFNKVKEEVIEILKLSPKDTDTCIDFLIIAKYFEKIGDHAENICEWVEFNETGEYKNRRII